MNNVADKISEETGINIGKTFYDFESAINIFRPKKDLWVGELPIYQLKLSEEDIKHFNELSEKSVEQGYLDKENNTWRSIKLKYAGEMYDAEIELHGDLANHWGGTLKSYNVKILNNESINNFQKFSLLIFEDRFLDSKIVKILSNEFESFDIRDDLVVLKINGVPQGIYYLVEKLDTTFLEHNKCSNCEIIKMKDSKFKDHPRIKSYKPYGLDYPPGLHLTPFDYELSHVDLEKSDLDLKKVLNPVNSLFKAVEEGDINQAVNYFDINQITTFEAQRMLLGFGQVAGDDLKMAYSATNSKFYPIPFEGGGALLQVDKGGFERSLNIYPTNDLKVKLFALLNRDDRIRQLKYKKVYQFIINKGDLFLTDVHDLVDKYLPYANAHKGSALGTKIIEKKLKEYEPLFKHNINLIKEVLEYATCYINAVEKGDKLTLEVIPDSISQLKFDSLKISLLPDNLYSGGIILKYEDENKIITKSKSVEKANSIDLTDIVKDFYFSTGLDEDLGTKKRAYIIEITFSNTDKILIENINAKMKNDITGKLLGDDGVYLQIANANDYCYDLISSSANDFMEMYKEFNWGYNNNIITLLEGDYTLKRDLIIPKGFTFNIEPGVQILIDEDKSIVSYSPVNIVGTENEPIAIKSLDADKPFGTLGIVGEEGQKSIINWLRLSGGNEKFINGIYFSGGLSIYHMDVGMSNTIISDNHADDGLNIKYSEIMIDNCLFTNNFADQFDGDFVEGVIKNSEFIENDPNADDNGDGLDFSGSKVIIKNNIFKGFRDKGVSIGEDTKPIILYNNLFENNNLGSAIKDASYAFFIKNSFKNNKIALSAYQKKVIYPSGGYFYLYDNDFKSNIKDYELDEKSYKEDLKLDEKTYDKIIEHITNDDLEEVFQTLDPYLQK